MSAARASATRATHDHEFSEYTRSLPMLTLLHLQRWDAVLQEPTPRGDRGIAKVLSEMARGIALVRTGQLDAANAALARLAPISDKLAKERTKQDFMDKMIRSVAGTAQAQLRAEIALAGKRPDEALAQQAAAVAASKFADDMEPPMLAGSPRQRLGAMQNESKRYAAAEQSFRDDLALRPANGWSLRGLSTALAAQGKRIEADSVARQLERSWPLADNGLRSPQ
jgi:tetratricopeptide (TPR) repeat protein